MTAVAAMPPSAMNMTFGSQMGAPFDTKIGHYGPDGQPVQQQDHKHYGTEMGEEEGWFKAESNRFEQERLAEIHLTAICSAVDERNRRGLCPDRRWTNDPNVFPDLNLVGTATSNPVIPFPPADLQYFVGGVYNSETSKLKPNAVPCHMQDSKGNSTWVRLVDFAPNALACQVFDETVPNMVHCGRILQGALENGHFVEALTAISLRPKLAHQLFYCYDSRRSVYIVRLFKHGTWMRVEIDDYVPIGPPGAKDYAPDAPICCRSENFPYVLWPSLVEKAYAKIHTSRCSPTGPTPEDRGGWETLCGGGSVEEALSDLTGGVSGRWMTANVAPDRIFLYLYELQRDTLFVCRPNMTLCELHDVKLNPYYPYVVNRAVVEQGRCFLQMFCGAPSLFDGGLQDAAVPWELINSELYPERSSQGFFWIQSEDFREYFDTVFECRLVNSGDVSIVNMPPPRNIGYCLSMGDPLVMGGATPNFMQPLGLPDGMGGPIAAGGVVPGMRPGDAGSPMPWYETVYANAGAINRFNEPEFSVHVPDNVCPCEIVCSIEQADNRFIQTTGERPQPVALLCKVYEQVDGQYYSNDLVCKSNWLPIRDAMVSFCCRQGGEYKIVCEFPPEIPGAKGKTTLRRMIFRCYSPRPNVTASASAAWAAHEVVEPIEPPKAVKWTFVGCQRQELYDEGVIPRQSPEQLDFASDCMRKPEMDLKEGIGYLVEEAKKDCSIM